MKYKHLLIWGIIPFLMTGCFSLRSTSSGYRTNSTTVYANGIDLCQNLDLQAIAVAFAQSSSIREFEMLINNSGKYITNLDLNYDGYVDYIRVVESYRNGVHVLLLQAALDYNTYQDVATIVVENPTYSNWNVEIIGAPYIYGNNYIVKPSYYREPMILSHFAQQSYQRWDSPWQWGNYPDNYRRQQPLVVNNYQIRVNNYMGSNRYCRQVSYPTECHYQNYGDISRQYQRNDYGSANPEKSFVNRTANIATSNSALARAAAGQAIRNANDINRIQTAADATSTRTATTATTTRNGGSRTGTTTSGTSGSSRGTTTTTTRSSGTSGSRSGSTTSGTSGSRSGSSVSNTRSGSTNDSSSGSRTATTSSSTSNSRTSSSISTRRSSDTGTSGTSTSATRTSSSTSKSSGTKTSSSRSSKNSDTKSSSSRRSKSSSSDKNKSKSSSSTSRTSSSSSSSTRSGSTDTGSSSSRTSSSSSRTSSSSSRTSR